VAEVQKTQAIAKPKRELSNGMKNVLLLIMSLGLISISIIAFVSFYVTLDSRKAISTPPIERNKIIATEAVRVVNLDPIENTLDTFLAQQTTLSGTANSIVRIDLSTTTVINNKPVRTSISAQEFFARISPNVPGAFVRSLGPTFVAGFYNNNSIWQPVIITRIDSYENAFSGMLAWENTLVEDFSPFFKTVPVPVAASTPTSTPSSSSTSTPKAAPSVKQSAAASSTTLTAASSKNTFTDEIVANKNARV
jgi:hypothetical protein